MIRHNAHVLKWYRWQHYWAVQERRLFAQLIWAYAFNSHDYEALQPAKTQPGSYRHEGYGSVYDEVERISLDQRDK
jgi:hypothetical protein